MAASQAPHPLAEAIAELAAPPLRPSYIRLQLYHMFEFIEESSVTLLLHVRPRHLAAGLEVAVHAGQLSDDGEEPVIAVEGQLFAVPATAAGVQAFAADLVAGGAGGLDESGERRSLRPSERPCWGSTWSRVDLEWLRPEQVRAIPVAGGPQRARLRVLPFLAGAPSPPLCNVRLLSESGRYGREQAALRRHKHLWEQQQLREAARERQDPEHPPRLEAAGAAGVGPVAAHARRVEQPAEVPDSEERYQQRYEQLWKHDVDRLTNAVASMLRLALRGRGTASLPLWQPPAPAQAEEMEG